MDIFDRNEEWVNTQNWQFIRCSFGDSENREYGIEINGIGFAVNDARSFCAEILEVIAKYRVFCAWKLTPSCSTADFEKRFTQEVQSNAKT